MSKNLPELPYYVGSKSDLTLFVADRKGNIVADNIQDLAMANTIAAALSSAQGEAVYQARNKSEFQWTEVSKAKYDFYADSPEIGVDVRVLYLRPSAQDAGKGERDAERYELIRKAIHDQRYGPQLFAKYMGWHPDTFEQLGFDGTIDAAIAKEKSK